MEYKTYRITIEKNGHFSAFSFVKLRRAGPQPTIKELKNEIDQAEAEPPGN